MSVVYSGDNITFADGSIVGGGWTGYKNRVINGAMMIDQRNRGAANTASFYILDRWLTSYSGGGTITTQRSTDAPAGFSNSALLTCNTADTSLASTDRYMFQHAVEGYNVADFNLGTSNAATFTISFWVKSNLTGTYSIAATNALGAGTSRSYAVDYTINSANTWEKKTITIVGDTSSVGLVDWNKTNSIGLVLRFGLGMGSSYQISTGTWQTTNASGSTNQVNWMATAGNTFYVTGVQIERGSSASSFEFRPYTTELQLCYRYYWSAITENVSSTNNYRATVVTGLANGKFEAHMNLPVTMRTTPALYTANILANGNVLLNWVGPGSSTLATNDGIVYHSDTTAGWYGTQTGAFASAAGAVNLQLSPAGWAAGVRFAFDAEL
jgi:hypothetical protein